LSEDDYVVGHIGRPAVAKGLEVLADVVDRLRRVRPGVRLLRVGPPPQPMDVPFAEAFDRSIKERGIADIVVRQPFSEDISKVLSVMDVLVQTSHQEGLAGVVMEAMAMELPVVATAAGGTAEVIRHRETGWLVQPGDGDGLVEGLQHARDNAHAAQEWARAARELIETDYSDDAMVNRTVALYEHLLARRARGDV